MLTSRARVPGLRRWVAVPVLMALLSPATASAGTHAKPRPDAVSAIDIALATGFQDTHFGYLQRGRALVASDFDLDGRQDFYVGNPGDDSYVLRNAVGPQGQPRFEMVQVLLPEENDEITWSATSLDYDDDGDYDLFIPTGGNEVLGPEGDGIGFSFLFENRWIHEGRETGDLSFVDVTAQAGIKGPVPPGESEPIEVAGAGAVAGDFDLDGDTDIYQSVQNLRHTLPALAGRDVLWSNDGDGTFTDVTEQVGLGNNSGTQHSAFIDYDNDGDLDLYENNWNGLNFMYRNELQETGTATFVDVTSALSPPGEDLHYPWESFAAAVTDFNADGWQDLFVFDRWQDGEPDSPYWPQRFGHAVFINLGVNGAGTHRGFVNLGPNSGINQNFPREKGSMGCQIGDVNGDGAPDVFVGNGAPMDTTSFLGGQWNHLFVGAQRPGEMPRFLDASRLVNSRAPEDPDFGPPYPPHPYRTHGSVIVDVDGDGTQELAVSEGGPKASPDFVREPDRLFKFVGQQQRYLLVHPVGDGSSVSRDAIGTRMALTLGDGPRTWTVHRTLLGGSCFSAHNGYDVHFGLANATRIESLEITWPDGTVEERTQGLSLNSRITVDRAAIQGTVVDGPQHVSSDTARRVRDFMAANPAPPVLVPEPITDPLLTCGGAD